MDRKVPLRSPETPKSISPQIALSQGRACIWIKRRRTERPYTLGPVRTASRNRSRNVVDYFSSWILKSIQIERNASNHVRARIVNIAVGCECYELSIVDVAINVYGRSRTGLN